MDIIVRNADYADLPSVRAINEHYVLNTVNTFVVHKPTLEIVRAKFEEARQRQLPYLVAIDRTREHVLGYSYALEFRGSLGYGQCVEISIFCDPGNRSLGVGSRLMDRLLHDLRQTRHVAWEHGHEDAPVEFQVKKAIAIIAVDDEAPLDLAKWYVDQFGFVKVGHLKDVGFKGGRTLDTIYLLKDL